MYILCAITPFCVLKHKIMNKLISIFLLLLILTSCRTPIASVTTTVKETTSIRDTIIKTPLPNVSIDKKVNLNYLTIQPVTIETPTSTITLKVDKDVLDVKVVNKDSIEVKAPLIEKKIDTVTEKVVVKKETPKLVIFIIGMLIALIIILYIRIKL